jgi:hypothetical protein
VTELVQCVGVLAIVLTEHHQIAGAAMPHDGIDGRAFHHADFIGQIAGTADIP